MTDLPGLFVVGTDTGVGKTRVAAAIARALSAEGRRVGVLKPVATGATWVEGEWKVDDADELIAAIGGGVATADVCPIAYGEPLAPPVAARRAGGSLTIEQVERAASRAVDRWQSRGAEVMVVEGVGGLLCPIADGATVADLAARLDYPLVVVGRRGLGTLNHVLMTVEAALGRSLRVAGVILNGAGPTVDPVAEATNPAELSRRLGPIPLLADLPHEPGSWDGPLDGSAFPRIAHPSPERAGKPGTPPTTARQGRPGRGGGPSTGHPPSAGAAVTLEGLGWYDRARPPRLTSSTSVPRPKAMPSSSDTIRPGGAIRDSDVDIDLGAVPLPPPGRGPAPADHFVLDDAPSLNIPLGLSDSGDGGGSGSGSSTFALPQGLVTPDPIVGALAAAEADAAGRPSPGPPPVDAPPDPEAKAAGTADALGGLDFDAPAPTRPAPTKPTARAGPARPSGGAEDDVEIEYVNGPNWPVVLLASYASAVTLALFWYVILPRLRGRGDADNSLPAPSVSVGARRADRSRKLEPSAPIPAERTTALGRPLRVGSLEITPLEVGRGAVTLRRAGLTGKREERNGGSGALILRVRLRNTSGDAVFAPLDEAFLRDRDDGLAESFVELGPTDRAYLYPLPVDSEWSIVGQDFPDLRPGEVKVSRVVTAADFPPTEAGATWRLKLRTGPDSTAVVGVSVPPGK